MSYKILDRIQALLDKANHPNTGDAEREAYLAKAAELMAAHRIEEAALRARNVARGFAETKRNQPTDIRLDWVSGTDEFYPVHQAIVGALARLTGVKLVHLGGGKLHVIGYPDDVDFFRMLWLSTHLTFSSK